MTYQFAFGVWSWAQSRESVVCVLIERGIGAFFHLLIPIVNSRYFCSALHLACFQKIWHSLKGPIKRALSIFVLKYTFSKNVRSVFYYVGQQQQHYRRLCVRSTFSLYRDGCSVRWSPRPTETCSPRPNIWRHRRPPRHRFSLQLQTHSRTSLFKSAHTSQTSNTFLIRSRV